MQFTIKESQNIPYFDHDKSLIKTVIQSGKRRNMHPLYFVLRKIKNIFLHRITFFCPLNSWRIKMHRWRGVNIGKNVYIGLHCVIDNAYPEFIYIEDDVSIAGEVTIIAHTNPYSHFASIVPSMAQPTIIKKGAWIGIKSIILPGVVVGENAIISAGSVVGKSVQDFTIVQGNPAKKVLEFRDLLTKNE
jgi:acetyltransferase-like isoleucine patch superfamily enzyme